MKLLNRHTTQEPHEDETIDLTPLIDVVFVVLILFILVAPLIEFDRIILPSRQGDQKNQVFVQEVAPIQIRVFANNTITLNGKNLSEEELVSALIGKKRKYPHAIPQLFHDKRACFGTYQNIKQAIEAAGFLEMDILIKSS